MAVKKKKRKVRVPIPIAVLTADSHLNPTTWTNRPTLSGDAFHAFAQVEDYAIDHNIAHMIIAGDVLDRRVNDAAVPDFIRMAMEGAEANRVNVHFIQGQHDLQTGNKPWLNSISSWPQHLHNRTIQIGDFNVYGIDWTRPSELGKELCNIPSNTDILVMHQVCVEFMGGVRECELTIAMLPHAKMLLIGDYHVHGHRNLTMTDGRKMLVVSPGSTCMQSIIEEPAKCFYILFDDMTVKSSPITGRHVLSTTLGSLCLGTHTGVDDFVEGVETAVADAVAHAEDEGLPDSMLKPILRVNYASSLEGAIHRIRRAVGNSAFLFEKRIVTSAEESEEETQLMSGVEAREIMDKAGLAGFLPKVLDREQEADLFLFCQEILDSREPLAVIESWRAKAGLSHEEEEEDAVA